MRREWLQLGAGCAFGLTGCERAPAINVLGSFFPVWIVCIVAGAGLTAVVRLLLRRAAKDRALGPGPVIYPSMAALFAFLLWLLFFR